MKNLLLLLSFAISLSAQTIDSQRLENFGKIDAASCINWTNADGVTIQAKLLSIEIDSVTLLVNDTLYHYDIKNLNNECRKLVAEYKTSYFASINPRHELDVGNYIMNEPHTRKDYDKIVHIYNKYYNFFTPKDGQLINLELIARSLRVDTMYGLDPVSPLEFNYLNNVVKKLYDRYNVVSIKVNDR